MFLESNLRRLGAAIRRGLAAHQLKVDKQSGQRPHRQREEAQ